MSIAEQIYRYIAERGSATRPELRHELGMHEKAVETAMRKLVSKGFIAETDRLRSHGEGRAAPVYIRGSVMFTQEAFTAGPIPPGRPRKIRVEDESPYSFAALGAAMNSMFSLR
ncbi:MULTISPECIES: winged helix-turn-helix domain-containing protein [unclassified Burkholderia]|uniref:winged helix-turn-helix domain-containing protein n=1 Tax=unclassified Burkholderia TaxID=2613784 RepID=UPI000F561871|nr:MULTISPECIES: winged helix-turn-helix domain-containing protein [unclassified Burkholderia]RQR87698.1 winged helix-turn-helix domain-containing protein [Burkholderia sp. Bp9011]RQR97043.1 winged helix-turn-helix domain-containing protein [Burkholderia sp. Bp9010]